MMTDAQRRQRLREIMHLIEDARDAVVSIASVQSARKYALVNLAHALALVEALIEDT